MKQKLFQAALDARLKSYSPYSHQKVGAAILTQSGEIFSGANVENSSYGATVCAERTAIFKAILNKNEPIVEVLVVTDSTPPWPPCGMCLQVLTEFASPSTVIHLSNLQGIQSSHPLIEFLPKMFTKDFLRKP